MGHVITSTLYTSDREHEAGEEVVRRASAIHVH